MDRYYACKEKHALKQEARHEKREAKMNLKAANAAAKGNFTKAAIFEACANHHHSRAQVAHFKAENAHCKTSVSCMFFGPHSGQKMQVYHHSSTKPLTYPTGTVAPPEGFTMGVNTTMIPGQAPQTNIYSMPGYQAYPTKPPQYPAQPPQYSTQPPEYPTDGELYPKQPPTYPGYPGEAPPPYNGEPQNGYPYPEKQEYPYPEKK
ncbi:uncharacterized protein LOC144448375 [Glandiceps talaboti]